MIFDSSLNHIPKSITIMSEHSDLASFFAIDSFQYNYIRITINTIMSIMLGQLSIQLC